MFKKIAVILATQKGIDESRISPKSTMEELGIDSLDAVDIIMDLEDEFDIKIDMRTQLHTVQEIIDLVKSLKNA